MAEVASIEYPVRRRHDKILGILFLFYGGSHLAGAAFVWLIFFVLAAEGYSKQLLEISSLALVGAPLLLIVPLLSGYSLLTAKKWAKPAVVLTSVLIVGISLIVVINVSRPRFTTNRIIFLILYVGVSMTLSMYGLWFVRKKSVG